MEYDTTEVTARGYQIELFKIAVKQNTIIYLPTGTGKTYIAVMLIKELSRDIRIPYSEGGKHTVFLVNTVLLVIQQAKYIARLTGLSCGLFTGDMDVDSWKGDQWTQQLMDNQVLVMTAQILVDALCHGIIQLNRINLIIFDECHTAVNNHPMRQIMQQFQNYPKNEQPRVLGISATLINRNVKLGEIEKVIKDLEITFQAKIATVNSLIQVQNYFSTPNETIVQFHDYCMPVMQEYLNRVIEELNEVLDSVAFSTRINNSSSQFRSRTVDQKLKTILIDVQEQLSLTGIYGASQCSLFHFIQLECIKKHVDSAETSYVIEYIGTELLKLRKLFDDEMQDDTEVNKIDKYSSDQVRKLCAVLKDFYTNKTDDQEFKCIIFVKRRLTAKVLYHILKNLHIYDEEFKFLEPDFIVGSHSDPYKSVRETLCTSKWIKESIHRFRNGLTNCIVATSIMDEGIDIPTCTLAVQFNLPMDVRTYIQSKGRIRSMNSQYTLLVAKSDKNYAKRYSDFIMIESALKTILVGNTVHRVVPEAGEIEDNLYKSNIEPYVATGEDGTKYLITENTAISTIYRYCSSLMKNTFEDLTPIWQLCKTDKDGWFKVSLQLPIISPLKTVIYGDAMQQIDVAKRSAAMKACIELHKLGELSDKFIPVNKNFIRENMDYLYPNLVDEKLDDKSEIAKLGTYKKKRHHQLQFPSALYGAYPLPKETVYLHVLRAVPTYPVPHDDNRNMVFYNMLCDNAGFAILSSKRMPQVPSFPIFMSVGELSVDVKVNHKKLNLSEEEIHFVKIFHTLIFREIVPVIKCFMVFDNYNRDNCFLIAPVDKNWEIDWEVLRKYQCIDRIPPPVPFQFKSNDYELALVVPHYRTSAHVYIVTQVCDDLTPNSCFPTDDFYSYVHYYSQKHGLAINSLVQPLLETKRISRNINCIRPRSMQDQSKENKRADSLKNFKEHLIPELCTRIKFPALYWLKTMTLPSILHRITQLLVAEDLRLVIATETKLRHLFNDGGCPPLVLTDEERDESFEPLCETTMEESIEDSELELKISGPEIDVLNTEAHQYPWLKDEEPPDLERNINEIQLIQIEHYCQFMSVECNQDDHIMKTIKGSFMNVSKVKEPHLSILSVNDSSSVNTVQIMYALTSKMGHDAFNLERQEILGDAYLKFITTLFLYHNFPNYTEGQLTELKGKIIGNRNLYYCGANKNIPGRIKVDEFIPSSNFIAPAYTAIRFLQTILLDAEVSPDVLYEIEICEEEQLSGHVSDSTVAAMQEKVLNWESTKSQTGMEHYLGVQIVSDKTVADCVEALIGAYLVGAGIQDTVTLLKWFQILPNDVNVKEMIYEISANPGDSEYSKKNVDLLMPWASDVEARIGYTFKNRAYLLQAFTHPSYAVNKLTNSYQRLEFLGDSILDFLITCYIYEKCGTLNPGDITDLRSALVNNITFACLSVRHGLHTALLAYAPILNNTIDRFVKFQEERDHVVDDELLYILSLENECNMVEYVDVPKVLGDLFESTIGAIYLDCGKDLAEVWKIIYSFMHPEIHKFSKNIPKQPIRVLYECQGAQPEFFNVTTIAQSNTVMVGLRVTIAGKVKVFHGFGKNKKNAKCAAAKLALKNLLCKA